jgi:hypothetical protein
LDRTGRRAAFGRGFAAVGNDKGFRMSSALVLALILVFLLRKPAEEEAERPPGRYHMRRRPAKTPVRKRALVGRYWLAPLLARKKT